jgi:hypothetical protein
LRILNSQDNVPGKGGFMRKECNGKCVDCRVVTDNRLVAGLRRGSFVKINCTIKGKTKKIPVRRKKSGGLCISV